jgi:TolB-like protein
MIYRFEGFSFDTEACELRRGGQAVPVEPQVFALLRLLIENRERLISKDEIVEQVWNGRIVSDAAIASRIKSARQALGDDGESQRFIRTVPKLGFRFVAEVEAPAEPTPRQPEAPKVEAARPSIAVLPFVALSEGAAAMAEALPHDLIAELSRLRWLFVIARGSSFRFRGPDADTARVREALSVRYVLSGVVELDGAAMALTVELADTRNGGVVWSERFRSPVDGVHELRRRIVQEVVGALELQIPSNEVRHARLSSPEHLDAWSAYHLGLHQMYRFDREGNAQAAAMFKRAIALEPSFARAHAALSFTHFEDAFLSFADDAERARALACKSAEAGLEHDPLDPFCNLVMGRVSWLSRDIEASLPWLDRAIRLNPNYAQAKYSRAWTETLMGQGLEARANADAAMQLSPLDPMAYAMLAVRAFSHVVQDEPAQAAEWGERAARSPGAHALVEMIAALGHRMNGDDARARYWTDSALRRHPGLTAEDFFGAFPFRREDDRARVSAALTRLGV